MDKISQDAPLRGEEELQVPHSTAMFGLVVLMSSSTSLADMAVETSNSDTLL